MTSFDTLAEQLTRLAPQTPDEIPVISLDPRRDRTDLATEVAHRWGEAMGLQLEGGEAERRRATTVLRGASGGRATVFHASAAVALRSPTASYDELFDDDPGDAALTDLVGSWTERLGVDGLVPQEDRLSFERLWRIKAAGVDPDGQQSRPVLCRAVGALRHHVRDLPVLGRASAHVELSGKGNLTAASLTLRRFADSRDEVLAAVRPRDAHHAACEVAAVVARMLGTDLRGDLDGELVAEGFGYGYLGLGRRRAQSLLAPVYVASVSIVGRPDQTRSAHLVPVAGSADRFVKLPSGSGASAQQRVHAVA